MSDLQTVRPTQPSARIERPRFWERIRRAAIEEDTGRVYELDGIRGFASVAVLLFHFGPESFGAVMPELRDPWLFPWINGYRAVWLFFVLSGDALAGGSDVGVRTDRLRGLALRRYTRLALPIALSSVTIFTLMKLELVYNGPASAAVYNPGWLGGFVAGIQPTLHNLVQYMFVDVFAAPPVPVVYNAFLWTMHIEFLGSGAIFIACILLPWVKRPLVLTAVATLGLWLSESVYCLFLFGLVLCQVRKYGGLVRLRSLWPVQLLAFALPAGLYVFEATHPGEPFSVRTHYAIACVLVLCMYVAAPFRLFFASRLGKLLGKLSFPLYLAQMPVLLSLMSWLVMKHYRYGVPESTLTLRTIIAVSVAAAFALAVVFYWVERLVLPPIDRALLRCFRRDTQTDSAGPRG
jgi:peptidoglycan/LPS O-acetylase OafA/YrhL